MTLALLFYHMRFFYLFFLLLLFCFQVYGVTLESEFQLGEKQEPTLDRLLPDVARYIQFNKNSDKLITKGMDGKLIEWDLMTKEKREIGHLKSKRFFAYSSDANWLLIQKSNNEITLHNLDYDNEILVTNGKYDFGSLSNDGSHAVLSDGGKTFQYWQLHNHNISTQKTFQTSMPIRNGLTLSNNAKYIATAEGTYRDGEGHKTIVEVWDSVNAKQPLRVFNTGEILGVWNLIFSQDESLLAIDTQNNAKSGIRVWDVRTGRQLLNKSGFEAYWTRALAFVPNKQTTDIDYLASGDEKGYLRIWKIPGGESLIWETYPTGIQTLAFSPNGEYLAVALWDTTIQILRWNTNE